MTIYSITKPLQKSTHPHARIHTSIPTTSISSPSLTPPSGFLNRFLAPKEREKMGDVEGGVGCGRGLGCLYYYPRPPPLPTLTLAHTCMNSSILFLSPLALYFCTLFLFVSVLTFIAFLYILRLSFMLLSFKLIHIDGFTIRYFLIHQIPY